MINVLIVANNLNPVDGGISTFIMNVFDFIDRTKVHIDFVIHMPQKDEIVKYIENRGSKIYQISPYNPIKYRNFWKAFLKNNSNYDIIHVHSFDPTILYLGLARKLNITTIVHSHISNMPKFDLVDFVCRINQFGSRFVADYFLGCSYKAISDRFGKKIANSPKSYIIPNGIDTEKFKFNPSFRDEKRKELNASKDQIVIGQVGRLDYPKNQLFSLKVFKIFHDIHPNSLLIFIGDGPDKKNIEKEVSRLNLTDSVFAIGSKKDVFKYLSAFDMFLFPSIYEGFGIALIESQCSGLNSFVFQEAIVDECDMKCGLLHKISFTENPKTWAIKMKNLIPNILSENRNQFSQYVKENKYDLEDSVKVLEKFYVESARKNHI